MRREIKIITEGQAMSGELSTTVYKTQGLTWREASFCESAIVPDLTGEKIELPLAVCPEAGEAIAKFWRKWARDRRRERSQAKLNAFFKRIDKCRLEDFNKPHWEVRYLNEPGGAWNCFASRADALKQIRRSFNVRGVDQYLFNGMRDAPMEIVFVKGVDA
jgi:hypothetical protein